ncbi:hypothetical protein SAMN05444359_101127 [Neolewinella agarilytica]|uniref:Uncharacterized protein n=1 Tax=Neolewinella agarilytica TaxID=478744 RepID=A0A1H8Z145_9BACT|nr:hypothetical protein SAMN05444359_101127 [Neolewinella agarilytica]
MRDRQPATCNLQPATYNLQLKNMINFQNYHLHDLTHTYTDGLPAMSGNRRGRG